MAARFARIAVGNGPRPYVKLTLNVSVFAPAGSAAPCSTLASGDLINLQLVLTGRSGEPVDVHLTTCVADARPARAPRGLGASGVSTAAARSDDVLALQLIINGSSAGELVTVRLDGHAPPVGTASPAKAGGRAGARADASQGATPAPCFARAQPCTSEPSRPFAAPAAPSPSALPPATSHGQKSSVQARLELEAATLGLTGCVFARVPSEYYDQSLEWRRDQLGAASVEHLCKSIISKRRHAAPCAGRLYLARARDALRPLARSLSRAHSGEHALRPARARRAGRGRACQVCARRRAVRAEAAQGAAGGGRALA